MKKEKQNNLFRLRYSIKMEISLQFCKKSLNKQPCETIPVLGDKNQQG